MSRYYDHKGYGEAMQGKPRKNRWRKFLIIACCCLAGLAVACGIALWCIAYYLKPDRIVKIIEDNTAQFLNARVNIKDLDYKLFSSYPWLEFEVDSLEIISKSLDTLSPSQKQLLPDNAALLASVSKIRGKINIHSLIHDKINIRGLEVETPYVNIVEFNDSISNFNILKTDPHKVSMPKTDISELKVGSPVVLNYFSLQKDTEANFSVDDFNLVKVDDSFYNIGFQGKIKGHYQDFATPGEIPLSFNTTVSPDLRGLNAYLRDLKMSISDLSLMVAGDIKGSLKGIEVNSLALDMATADIFTLLNILPDNIRQNITLPRGLQGRIPVDIHVDLRQPVKFEFNKRDTFNQGSIPPLAMNLKIENGILEFLPQKGKKIDAKDILLDMDTFYNPENPEETRIEIKNLKMDGEGIWLYADGKISGLLEENQYFNGNLEFKTTLVETISKLLPDLGVSTAGHLEGKVKFSGEAMDFGQSGFKDIAISGVLNSTKLYASSSSFGKLGLGNFKGNFNIQMPSYPTNDYTDAAINFNIKARDMNFKGSGINMDITGLGFDLGATDKSQSATSTQAQIDLKISGIKVSDGKMMFAGENLNASAQGGMLQNPSQYSPPQGTLAANSDSSIIESRIDHTPLSLDYSGGGLLQTLINMVDVNLDINLGGGYFQTPQYLYPISFSGLDLTTDLNKVSVHTGKVDISDTGLSLEAELSGLTDFLNGYSSAPLNAKADIEFDNVDINRLSLGYFGALLKQGLPYDSIYYDKQVKPYSKADSLCIAIPRNITAEIALKAKSACYMQYDFSPLSTSIIVKNGDATLKALTIGTPYCTAVVDWTYSTSRLDDIFMNLKAKIKDFNFQHFYSVFPSLTQKMPEIENLSGDINANLGCRFTMFPNMFMDAESLKGWFEVDGSNMQFARQGKIERITHLLMIDGDQPIKIDNMHITGAYHDNLLQIDPFVIGFDDYELKLGGVNNVAGDMFYHIALEKSPFHLPFGVSLYGKMKHPSFRLGGTRINDYKAEMVSSDIYDNIDVNIMANLRYGWNLFLQEAAKYEGGLINNSNGSEE